ncbi:MAG: hypothetical protein Q8L37_06685 [Candidatus Gottesmanbacteria bacterium]|nr:hypothetical protein [Candidatus Gottesmanbacteria bacterium]
MIIEDSSLFFIRPNKGKNYSIEILHESEGVVPTVELSTGARKIIQTNKDNPMERLVVDRSLFDDYIEIKIMPGDGSKIGCDASFDLIVSEY